MSLTWETIDENACYPEPRYAATDGPDRYEIHYNRKAKRLVLFQNGEAWRSQTPDYGAVHRPAVACHPSSVDAAKAMAEEWAEATRRNDEKWKAVEQSEAGA
jgi:hypothetical protein